MASSLHLFRPSPSPSVLTASNQLRLPLSLMDFAATVFKWAFLPCFPTHFCPVSTLQHVTAGHVTSLLSQTSVSQLHAEEPSPLT